MSDTGRMIVACFCGLALVGGFLMLFGGGTVLVQERTEAALPSPEQVVEVEQVEQVDNGARMICFAHLRDVQEQGATLNYDSCSIEDVQEYVDADGACKRHMLATGNICQE